jgi:hypothetical protein
MTPGPTLLELIHRYVGYPTAFLVAPLALLAFARPGLHRRFGAIYLGLMVFLYLSGTWRTLTHHDWASWPVYRNLAFNFLGFSMVIYAWRAIVLFRRPGPTRPERLDWLLAGVLACSVLFLTAVALIRDLPMRIFALIGIGLVILEFRELRAGFQPRALLFRRHLRYTLLSYYYVLTVVSLVHLKEELPREVKWLWPTGVGMLALWLATRGSTGPGGVTRARSLRMAVWITLGFGGVLGSYALTELARGSLAPGQAEELQRPGGMEPEPEIPADPGLQ